MSDYDGGEDHQVFSNRSGGGNNRIYIEDYHSGGNQSFLIGFSDTWRIATGYNFTPGAWYQLVLSWENSTRVRAYQNGIKEYDAARTALGAAGGTCGIGGYSVNNSYLWEDLIDYVAAYNRALTDAEVLLHYERWLKRADVMTRVWMMPWGKAAIPGNIKQIATIDWASLKQFGTIPEASLKQVASISAN